MKLKHLFIAAILSPFISYSQYAPQAGVAGSTAIAATSGLFTGWATGCSVIRGYQDVAQPSLGYTTTGDSTMAVGPANNTVISLGDGGIATLSFAQPIINGSGADFAVFENGFANPQNPEEAFLELAFVEVSSDGIHFTRFPATSRTQDTAQIAGAGTYMNARYINNLAGKYIAGYGTPFDLAELSGKPNLDINHITHVRIIDVVGNITATGSRDSSGHLINDPYPTPFPTGGFDLDAVGVLHAQPAGIAVAGIAQLVTVYPNPAVHTLYIRCNSTAATLTATVTTTTGAVVLLQPLSSSLNGLDIANLTTGVYYLTVTDENNNRWVKKIVKY